MVKKKKRKKTLEKPEINYRKRLSVINLTRLRDPGAMVPLPHERDISGPREKDFVVDEEYEFLTPLLIFYFRKGSQPYWTSSYSQKNNRMHRLAETL